MSDQIEYQEYEDPNQVHKVPVQTDFFNHFIPIVSLDIYSAGYVEHDDRKKDHTGEHVKSVKPRDEKEQGTKCFGSVHLLLHLPGGDGYRLCLAE